MDNPISKIQITFKDSIYLSRLYIEINICIKTLNDINNAHDFISEKQDDYKLFCKEIEYHDKKTPFNDYGQLKELRTMLFCRAWDSFVLYLKILIFASEMDKKTLSKSKISKIEQYNLTKIKRQLDELKICPKNQPQWDEIQNIKKFRDRTTHTSVIATHIEAIKFQSTEPLKKRQNISEETIFKSCKYLIEFSKLIDQEFLKNYSGHFFDIFDTK